MTDTRNLFLLCALFVVAGVMHFVIPDSYVSIMPPWVPRKLELVYISGLMEIAGGLALLDNRTRRAAGIGLVLLLIAVFPANVQMLMNAIGGNASQLEIALLWARLPLQPLLIVWTWRAAIRRRVASNP